MIYRDLEKLYQKCNIPNKYILTIIVAKRARQLSEQKGRNALSGGNVKFISQALDELESGRIGFRFAAPSVVVNEVKSTHVVMEN